MTVCGVDLSLVSTGIARASWDTGNGNGPIMFPFTRRIQSKGTTTATLRERANRLVGLVDRIAEELCSAELVVIESPAYSSLTGHQHDRSGLWWLVIDRIINLDAPPVIVEVSPAARAKYATGKGNAPKDAVLSAVCKRYPAWDVTGNDIADALILAAMGCRHLGQPIDDMPLTHQAAMTGIKWPELSGAI